MVGREALRTLVLVRDQNKILLGRKKRGFGMGKWNGFGGKLQGDETLEEAAARELHEEAGIVATALEPRGALSFTFQDGIDPLEVRVFIATAWIGTPQETEEMAPQWFPLNQIPYSQMWADDLHWLPKLLAGEHFTGVFVFQDTETLVSAEVKSVAAETLSWHV